MLIGLVAVYGLFLAPNRLLAPSVDGDAVLFSVVTSEGYGPIPLVAAGLVR